MKRIFIIISFFVIANAFTQDKIDCQKKYEEFEAYRKSFNEKSIFTQTIKEEALSLIKSLQTDCETYNKEIYIHSEDMLLKILNPMNLGVEKQQLTKELTNIYDQYSKNFPETIHENNLKKIIISYINNVYSDKKEALKVFDEMFNKNKHLFSVQALLIYANLLTEQGNTEYESYEYIKKINALNVSILNKISQLEEEKKEISDQKIIKKINTDIFSLEIESRNTDIDNYKFSCEDLSEFYKSDFNENKSNLLWIEKRLSSLIKQKCVANNDFFSELTQTYYDLKKTAKSALYMGNLAQIKRQSDKAEMYFNESAELETNNIEKAKLYYQIANINYISNKSKAKLFLEKAIENNPEGIEAVILLSRLYTEAPKDCFNSDFEYKSRYFLAIETLEKFAKTNLKHKASIQKLVDNYLEEAPTKKEIKRQKMNGKMIKVGCWIDKEFKLTR